MKVGFLGTGMIVKDLMHTIDQIPLEKKYLLGTDATREETEQIATDNHFDGTFYDYDELLEADIDTVYVALPNFLHYAFAKKALEAGKNVICEKPVTSNYEEFRVLRNLAEEKHLMLFEAMNIHYMPSFQAVKEKLNELGNIRIVSLNYSQYSSRYDRFKAGVTLPVFDPKKSGGALMDLNVYNIHFVIGLFGKPQNVHYQANVVKGIDTSGILTLTYPDFQVVCIGAKDCKAPVLSTIQGDEGNIEIHVPVNQFESFTFGKNQGEPEECTYSEGKHRLYYEWMNFIDMVDHQNYDRMEKMLDVSGTVSEVMTQARKDAGIVFDADLRMQEKAHE